MKERIREIAGELIKVAAMRATRAGVVAEPDTSYPAFVNRFPYEETDDQDRAIADVLQTSKPASRWTGWSAATSASARPRWRFAQPSSWRCRASRLR